MRTISQEDARRILLTNQLLGSRQDSDALAAAEHLVVLQAQYSTSPAQALLARGAIKQSKEFDRLHAGGAIRKGWNLRKTLHAYPESLRAMVTAAVGQIHRKAYVRTMTKSRFGTYEEHHLARISEEIRAHLRNGPLSRRELHERIPDLQAMGWTGWGADVMPLSFAGEVVHVGGSLPVFQSIDPPEPMETTLAIRELAHRYIRAYGPASLTDFCYWTMLTRRDAAHGFAQAAEECLEVHIEGQSGSYYVEQETPLEPDSVRKITLLPKFDSYTLAYRDKSRVMMALMVPLVVRPAGQIEAMVLIDGAPSGTWRLQASGKTTHFSATMLKAVSVRNKARIEAAAARLIRAHGAQVGTIQIQ